MSIEMSLNADHFTGLMMEICQTLGLEYRLIWKWTPQDGDRLTFQVADALDKHEWITFSDPKALIVWIAAKSRS